MPARSHNFSQKVPTLKTKATYSSVTVDYHAMGITLIYHFTRRRIPIYM